MTQNEPAAEQPLAAEDAVATPWAEARARLETPERDRTYWLATVRDDRQHPIPPRS